MTPVLLIVAVMFPQQLFAEASSYVESDITKALRNIKEMENDLLQFYRQWDALSRGIASQGTRRALDSCSRDHQTSCTPEIRQALSKCVTTETKTIHDAVVTIYDDQIRTPWEREFRALRAILEHPQEHQSQIQETIWTVHQDSYSNGSIRSRFYTSLVNFQVPNAAPELYPIDKVYKLCLLRHFPRGY